jgi:hypothetical protein
MSNQSKTSEWALMLRGFFALFSKKVSIEPLIDADVALELTKNARIKEADFRRDYRPTALMRLRLLRRNFLRSFLFLTTATLLALIVSSIVSLSSPSWLGIASVFFLAWSTVARLGYSGKSWSGDSVFERLDERIFRILFWFGTFLGILSLA